MHKLFAALALSALVSTGAAHAQAPAGPAAGPPDPSAADFASLRLRSAAARKLPDNPGTGPFAAIKAVDPAFPDHVIYRPADLAAVGRKLPVLLWGTGGCSSDAASQRLFLEEVASHGYLIIAAGTIQSGPGIAPPPPPPAGPQVLKASTTYDQVLRGLDQAAAANAAPGPWHDRIDLSKVAVSGYSCGGLQALQIAGDPRIKTVVIMHSGVFNTGNEITGIKVEKSILTTLHTPTFYLLGGPRDVAYKNGTDDVARITGVPLFYASHDVGHGGTFYEPNGGEEAQILRKWLDWILLGDTEAAKTFVGADCGLCQNPAWTVTKKGL